MSKDAIYSSIEGSKRVTMTWRATSIFGCPWAEGKKGAPKAAAPADDDKGQPGFTLNER